MIAFRKYIEKEVSMIDGGGVKVDGLGVLYWRNERKSKKIWIDYCPKFLVLFSSLQDKPK